MRERTNKENATPPRRFLTDAGESLRARMTQHKPSWPLIEELNLSSLGLSKPRFSPLMSGWASELVGTAGIDTGFVMVVRRRFFVLYSQGWR